MISFDFCLVPFPLAVSTSGPKIFIAIFVSSVVTGLLVIHGFTYFIRRISGASIMWYNFCALLALATSRSVYPSILFFTVCNICVALFLFSTSCMNSFDGLYLPPIFFMNNKRIFFACIHCYSVKF